MGSYFWVFLPYILILAPCGLKASLFPPQGEVFPIFEREISEMLERKMKEEGERELPESELIGRIQKSPRGLSHLQEAQRPRKWSYDPTFTAKETVRDSKGHVLVEKGKSINPLEQITLTEGLLFIDGDNPEHVAWAEGLLGDFKWILLRGNPLALEERLDRSIYFDQGGIYSQKFSIGAVPARVVQEGHYLVIEEVPL